MVTTKLTFTPNTKLENEKAGMVVMGLSYAGLALVSKKDGMYLMQLVCKDAVKGTEEGASTVTKLKSPTVYLRVKVTKGARCQFNYSEDGKTFISVGDAFTAQVGRWIGAKVGLFCTRETQINDSGYADVDWFRIEPVQ